MHCDECARVTTKFSKMQFTLACIFLVLFCLVDDISGFAIHPFGRYSSIHGHRQTCALQARRSSAVTVAALSLVIGPLLINSQSSLAVDGKEQKKYESCLSKCIYQETREPPIGADNARVTSTKPRSEVVHDCKVTCKDKKSQQRDEDTTKERMIAT
jgi:hypothetical protein